MILILAHASDPGANAVAAHCGQEPGATPVRIVRPELLGLAHWSHRVDAHGRASTRLSFPQGEPLDSADVHTVLNRIRYLPAPRFQKAPPKDRDYALTELQSVAASWLASLGDRVTPSIRRHHLVTPALSSQRWVAAAAEAGLPVIRRRVAAGRARLSERAELPHTNLPSRSSSDPDLPIPAGRVLVAGKSVSGPLSTAFGDRAIQAAKSLGFPLLEFRFGLVRGRTELCDVDPFPELTEPGDAECVAALLKSRSIHSTP